MRFFVFSLAVFFGILSLAPNMQGGQFFKLSEMVEHFEDHQQSDDSFSSFMSFVQEHYFSNGHANSNERSLPFKSLVAAPLLLVMQEFQLFIVSEAFPIDAKLKHPFGDPSGSIKTQSMAIWNPPRLV